MFYIAFSAQFLCSLDNLHSKKYFRFYVIYPNYSINNEKKCFSLSLCVNVLSHILQYRVALRRSNFDDENLFMKCNHSFLLWFSAPNNCFLHREKWLSSRANKIKKKGKECSINENKNPEPNLLLKFVQLFKLSLCTLNLKEA